MNRRQMLAAAAAAHHAWLDKHAEAVPAVPEHSRPHDGDPASSDYAEHHADRSAPPDVDDLLSEQLAALLADDPPGGDDVALAEGWAPPVPNVLLDLREAGSDRKLRAYWVRGEGAAKIGWGTGGDFKRCVSHLGKYVTDPEGLCAEYHKAATGQWPGKGRGH